MLVGLARNKKGDAEISALGEFGGQRAVDVLAEIIRDAAPDSRMRLVAIRALASSPSRRGAEVLLSILEPSWPYRRDRAHAVSTLGTFGEHAPVEALRRVLVEDEDVMVQLAAVDALQRVGTDESKAALSQAAESEKLIPSLKARIARILKRMEAEGLKRRRPPGDAK